MAQFDVKSVVVGSITAICPMNYDGGVKRTINRYRRKIRWEIDGKIQN